MADWDAAFSDLPPAAGAAPVGNDWDAAFADIPGYEANPVLQEVFRPNVAGTVAKAVGIGVADAALNQLPSTIAKTVRGRVEGDTRNPGAVDRYIANSDTASKRLQGLLGPEEQKAVVVPGGGVVPDITAKDVAEGAGQLGYSAPSMAAGLAAGVATANPVAAPLAAGATAALTGYRATLYDISKQATDAFVQKHPDATPEQITSYQGAIAPLLTEYALWEAGPEALSQAVTMGLIKAPIADKLAKAFPLLAKGGQAAKANILGKIASGVIKTGADMAEELTTETITQKGQGDVESRLDLREKPPGWKESFDEVYPQTIAMSALQMGGGAMANSALERAKAAPAGAPLDAAFSDLPQATKPEASAPAPQVASATTPAAPQRPANSTAPGVDPGLVASIIGPESGGNPNAKNPRSSAYGMGQIIDSTWTALVKKYGETYGLTEENRSDPQAQAIGAALVVKDTQEYLRKTLGREPSAGEVYMGYVLGEAGGAKFIKNLEANPNTPALAVVGAKAANANAAIFFEGTGEERRPRTLAEVQAIMSKKVGQPGTQTAQPQQPGQELMAQPELDPEVAATITDDDIRLMQETTTEDGRITHEKMAPESQATMNAQLAALLDPGSTKEAMLVTEGSPMPANIPANVLQVQTPKGVALTTNPEAAQSLQQDASIENIGRWVLGYPFGKEVGLDRTVRALDANGLVVAEVAVPAAREAQAIEAMRGQSPVNRVDVVPAVQALNDRQELVRAEGAAAPQPAAPQMDLPQIGAGVQPGQAPAMPTLEAPQAPAQETQPKTPKPAASAQLTDEDRKALDIWRKDYVKSTKLTPPVDPVYANVRGRIDAASVSPEERKALNSKFGRSIWAKSGKGLSLDILEQEMQMTPELGAVLREDYGSDNLYTYLLDRAKTNKASLEEAIREIDAEYERIAQSILEDFGIDAERELGRAPGENEAPARNAGQAGQATPEGTGEREQSRQDVEDFLDSVFGPEEPTAETGKPDTPKYAKLPQEEDTDNAPRIDATSRFLDTRIGKDLRGKPFPSGTFRSVPAGGLPSTGLSRAAQQLADILGVRLRFWTTPDTDLRIAGFHLGDTLYIEADSPLPHLRVLGHEFVHHLKRTAPELYKELVVALQPYVDKVGWDREFRKENSLFPLKDRAAARESGLVQEEVLGNLVGDQMTRGEFWEELARQFPRLFKRAADWLMDALDKFLGSYKGYQRTSEQAFTDLKKVREIVAGIVGRYAEKHGKQDADGAADAGPKYQRKAGERSSPQGSASKENTTGVVVGGRPGEMGWSLSDGTTSPPPIQHPVAGKPRLENVGKGVQKLLSSSGAKKLIEDMTGASNIKVTPIEGTWLGEPEPSFVLTGDGLTFEAADAMSKVLGLAFAQDGTVVTMPNYDTTEGTPTVYLSNGKKLTADLLRNIQKVAKEHGLDFSTSTDGKSVKFMHFGGADAFEKFEDSVDEIRRSVGLEQVYLATTRSKLNEYQEYKYGLGGREGEGSWLEDSGSGPSALFRRTVDHLLVPYAKVVGGEGYRFSVQRFQERFGLTDPQAEYIRERLRPKSSGGRSTVPLVNGSESLPVEHTVTKDGTKKANVTDVMWALQNRAAQSGLIEPGDYGPQAKKIIAETIADEVLHHVRTSGGKSAIGWYDAALKRAKDLYATIFPEIATDPSKSMLFDAILGITSQGSDVHTNSTNATRIYDLVREGKSLPEAVSKLRGSFGNQTRAIENNLLKLDHLLEVNGPEKMRKVFNTRQTVGEWNARLRTDPNLKGPDGSLLKVQGASRQKVTGWSVFGPKIGSFINNLHGDYSTLTADLWFSRTWNRILGFTFVHSPAREASQYQRFKEEILSARESGQGEIGKMSDDKFDNLITDPDLLLQFAEEIEGAYRKGGYKDKTDLNRSAKNWVENRGETVAAPRSDLERNFQQETVEEAQRIIKRRAALSISVADIQAALWYHEKELFGHLGAGNEKAAPADYGDAAKNTVQSYRDGALHKKTGAPVGGDVMYQRVRHGSQNEQGFYSQMQRILDAKLPGKGDPKMWADLVRSLAKKGEFKAEELQWSGLEDWLAAQKGKVSKEQVLDFLAANQIELKEVVKGSSGKVITQDMIDAAERRGDWDEHDRLTAIYEDQQLGNNANGSGNETKFSQYQLPGGENYREMLLTLPQKNADGFGVFRPGGERVISPDFKTVKEAAEYISDNEWPSDFEVRPIITKGEDNYKSSHWDEPNVLAHVRFSERTDADGKRVLHVEEIQSDWGQAGRKKGFQVPEKAWTKDDSDRLEYLVANQGSLSEAEAQELGKLRDKGQRIREKIGVPPAPFVGRTESWAMLSMKRMIRYAAENGFDRVAWTPAEEHFNRWGSEEIAWKKDGQDWIVAATEQRGGNAGGVNIEEDARARGELLEEKGKRVASKGGLRGIASRVLSRESSPEQIDKIVDRVWERMQAEDEGSSMPRREGMIGFYDKILPSEVGKYVKKWGAKVGTTKAKTAPGEDADVRIGEYPDGTADVEWSGGREEFDTLAEAEAFRDKLEGSLTPLHAFDITPDMKASVMGEGQPLYQRVRHNPQIDTPEFKKWFGDSKVVDKDGKPLVVYHGTGTEFFAFDPEADPLTYEADRGKQFFTSSAQAASGYAESSAELQGGAPRVIDAYLKIENPREEVVDGSPHEWWDGQPDYYWDMVVENGGHDGLIIRGDIEALYVTTRPTQIKSATGNSGAFDPGNPDIRYQRVPQTETPEFKKWGEGAPTVNANGWSFTTGKPVVVLNAFHGAPDARDLKSQDARFKSQKEVIGLGRETHAHWFAAARSTANTYADDHRAFDYQNAEPGIIEAYLKFRNPLVVEGGNQSWRDAQKKGRTTDLIEDAQAAGHDGVIILSVKDDYNTSPRTRATNTFVVFSPEQIKSVDNRGTFDPEDPRIRYQRRPGPTTFPVIGEDGVRDLIVQKIVDKFNRLKNLQKLIKDSGGVIDDTTDTYLKQELFHGRTEARLKDFEKQHVEPLAKRMAALKLSLKDVGDFLYASHAPKRNAVIAAKNEYFRDNNIPGSGMSDADAAQIIDGFRQAGKLTGLQEIQRMVRAVNAARKDLLLSEGLIDPALLQAWEATYGEDYVPLKGLPETDAEIKAMRTGRGFDIRGQESKRAAGRESRANSEEILANVLASMEETIVRAEKNRVGQTFLEMALMNPNPALWEVDVPHGKAHFNAKTGEITYGTDPMWRLEDNVLSVKVDGQEHYVTIHDPVLAAAMKNLGASSTNGLLRALATLNRFQSLMLTSLDPEFVLSNAVRDIQTAGVNLQGFDGIQGKGRLVGQALRAVPGIMEALRSPNPTGPWAQLYERYRKAGGKIGFFGLLDLEAQNKRIQRHLREAKGDPAAVAMKTGRYVADLVSDVNASVENATRLSVFKLMLDNGVSEEQAASAARNITVNFNRHGEWGPTITSLYMFGNAGIQGTARFFQALGTSKRVQKVALGIVLAGAAMAALNRAIGGDDEDGESYYDSIPEFERERNIIIMRPGTQGKYFKIPLPYGYNVLWVTGDRLGSIGQDKKSALEHSWAITKAMLNAFNPLDTSGDLVKMALPTALKPGYELQTNRNFMDVPIWNPNQKQGEPDSYSPLRKTGEVWTAIAQTMNDITGGNQFKPGMVDIHPESIRHIWDAYTGGLGKLGARIVNLSTHFGEGGTWADAPIKDVPFLRRFAGEHQDFWTSRKYRDRSEEVKDIGSLYESMKEENPEQAKRFKAEHLHELIADEKRQALDKRLAKIRKAIKGAEDEKAPKAKIDALRNQETTLQKAWLREYNEGLKDKVAEAEAYDQRERTNDILEAHRAMAAEIRARKKEYDELLKKDRAAAQKLYRGTKLGPDIAWMHQAEQLREQYNRLAKLEETARSAPQLDNLRQGRERILERMREATAKRQ